MASAATATEDCTSAFHRQANGIAYAVEWFDHWPLNSWKSIESHAHRPLPEMAEAILSNARAVGKQTYDQTLLMVRRVS